MPDPLATETPIRLQDFGPEGITHAQKLEGCYWGGRSVYFVSSFATVRGGLGRRPLRPDLAVRPEGRQLTLVVIFGPDTDLDLPGEEPDNICLAPSGGLMVCEDGEGAQHVFGLTRRGTVYPMARDRQNIGTTRGPRVGRVRRGHLLAGPPHDVRELLHPGTTFAVTGPWRH